jgi:3',5'-nucleoside bisphosphate phosphatase
MIDLHAHTNISDGTATPEEVIRAAKQAGLKAIAITDHDSIDGHEEAQAAADSLGVNYIKGIEFSVVYGENRLIHILGIGIDPERKGFMDIYRKYRKRRSSRLNHVFQKISDLGVIIRREDVEPHIIGGYMDRQAIARYLVAEGVVPSIKMAWMEYLDSVPYAEGELIEPKDAFRAIREGGGKSFLAHFHLPIGLKGYSEKETRRRLGELKEWGLDGLEYYYPSFTEEDRNRCARYIEEFGFLKSGGTDFHGENRAHIKLGTGEGDFRVSRELLNSILPEKAF